MPGEGQRSREGPKGGEKEDGEVQTNSRSGEALLIAHPLARPKNDGGNCWSEVEEHKALCFPRGQQESNRSCRQNEEPG